MSNLKRRRGNRPPYPVYPHTRFEGCLPPPPLNASSAMFPWDTNPYYQQYPGTRGRYLAGLSGVSTQMQNAEPTKDYANELDLLAISDDVVGNGVFDPPGSGPNINADYGVFADHQSLPGYVYRDRDYAPSEVIDATTGQPIMYVPAGAVPIDNAQRQAFLDKALWQVPPGLNPWDFSAPEQWDTTVPREAGWPLGATPPPTPPPPPPPPPPPATASVGKMFLITAIAGLSVGMVLALVVPSK